MPIADCGFEDRPEMSGRQALVFYGPTLFVEIGFDPAYLSSQLTRPDLPPSLHPALVDTGAMESCIDSDLAMSLQLPVIDRINVSGAHGSGEVNLHLAQVHVPSLNFTVHGEFAGVHLQAGGQPHFALIGRTFLEQFTMNYHGKTGAVTLRND